MQILVFLEKTQETADLIALFKKYCN